MTETELDPHTWFGQRELSFCPNHFVICTTPLTTEAHYWVITNLRGRYALLQTPSLLQTQRTQIAFESSKEAMFYELTWS